MHTYTYINIYIYIHTIGTVTQWIAKKRTRGSIPGRGQEKNNKIIKLQMSSDGSPKPPAQHREARWMFSAASVCLSVCQHDNFRTIKHRMTKVGGYMHSTKISSEFKCVQRSTSLGTKKTKKCGNLFGSRALGSSRRPRAALFSEVVLGGAATPVEKSACCLVTTYNLILCSRKHLLSLAGKVTVGLALHWPYVTDCSVSGSVA